MHSVRKLSIFLMFCFISSLALVSCGGGGGGGGTPTPPDTTAPTLQSTTPTNGAGNVGLNTQVTITWNEAVDCTTVDTTSVTISPAVAWTRSSCSGTQAIFIPSGQNNSTTYTISLGAAVTDVAGNHQTPTSFSYTTVAASDTVPPLVQSTSPTDGAGNVGLNTQVTLTWNEAVDCTTVDTTSITISPAVTWNRSSCSGNQATFVPAGQNNGTTYTISLGAGVTDVAGNHQTATSFSYTTLAATDTTPPTLQSTSPANGAANVSLNTPVTLTWNEPVNCATVTTANVTIAPAVTWAQASCAGNQATFLPSGQASATTYTISLGTGITDVAGNHEAAASFSYNTTAATSDITPPVLQSTVPADGATGIAVNAPVTLNWSEAVDCNSVNTTNITISSGSLTRVSCLGSQAIFLPSGQTGTTTYTVTVNGSVTDIAGNAGAGGSFSYTTAAPPDTTPPTLTSSSPASGAVDVPLDSSVTLTWSEAVNCATVSTINISIAPAAGITWQRTNCSGNQAVFTPTGQAGNTAYTVSVNGNVTDLAGNAGSATSFNYTTAPIPDTTPPTITLTTPAAGATNVAVNSNVAITWSEAVKCSTVNTSNITIAPAAGVTWNLSSCSGNQAVFTPAGQAISTLYTINAANVQDSAGNTAATTNFSYTTASTNDTTPPTLTSIIPAAGSEAVVVNSRVWLEWSEPIDCTTVNTGTVTLTPNPGWTLVDCVSALGRAVFEPSGQEASIPTTYTVTVTTGVKDLAGNPMARNVAKTYTAALPAAQPFPSTQDAEETSIPSGNAANSCVPITADAPPLQRTLYSTVVFPTADPRGPGFSTGNPMGDYDWYSVVLTAGTTYEFSVSYLNATGDSYLDLFYNDPSNGGALTLIDATNFDTYGPADLGFQDDYLGRGSEIVFTPKVTDTYKFRVITTAQNPNLLDFGPIGMLAYNVSVHQLTDNDNDSFSSYYDCNDNAAGINQNATDVPGDLIDQDCSGTDELAPTAPDAAEPDSFAAPQPMLERQAGDEYAYEKAVFVNNERTLDSASDMDYFSLTLAPYEKVILTVPITLPAPAILQADVYTSGQLETATPVFSGPAQDLAITNASSSPASYIVRFSGASAAGGYYVPTFYSVGVDSDGGTGDGFYTEDVDLNRDCSDSDLSINPGVDESQPALIGDGIDQNCDGGDGIYIINFADPSGFSYTAPGALK